MYCCRMDRVSNCESLLNRNKIKPFGSEWWRVIKSDSVIATSNENGRMTVSWRTWSTSQDWWPGSWRLCCGIEGIDKESSSRATLYRHTLNSDAHCEQLDRLNKALAVKFLALVNREGIMFRQDNAMPHTRQKFRELGFFFCHLTVRTTQYMNIICFLLWRMRSACKLVIPNF